MNLTEASEVAAVLRAVYIDRNPDDPAAITAAKRLAARTEHPLSQSGRKHIRPEQVRPGALTAEGAGPLLDPDCRDGKCGSCIGAPCEHECHQAVGGG